MNYYTLKYRIKALGTQKRIGSFLFDSARKTDYSGRNKRSISNLGLICRPYLPNGLRKFKARQRTGG